MSDSLNADSRYQSNLKIQTEKTSEWSYPSETFIRMINEQQINKKIKDLDEYKELILSFLKLLSLEDNYPQKNIASFCTNLLIQLEDFKEQHKTRWYNQKTKYERFDEFLRFSMKNLIELWSKGTINHLETFLSKNNIVNIQNTNSNTVLHLTAFSGNLAAFQELIKHSNPNIRNKFGNTALHMAAFKNNLEIVKILLGNNANIDIKNEYGYTALSLARQQKNKEIVEILCENETLEIGIDVFEYNFKQNKKEINNIDLQQNPQPTPKVWHG